MCFAISFQLELNHFARPIAPVACPSVKHVMIFHFFRFENRIILSAVECSELKHVEIAHNCAIENRLPTSIDFGREKYRRWFGYCMESLEHTFQLDRLFYKLLSGGSRRRYRRLRHHWHCYLLLNCSRLFCFPKRTKEGERLEEKERRERIAWTNVEHTSLYVHTQLSIYEITCCILIDNIKV